MNYITLDYELICNRELKDIFFKIYLLINKYSSREGYCWVGNKRLAEELAVAERRVKEYIKGMEEAGLIACDCSDGYRKITPLMDGDRLLSVRLNSDILMDKDLSGKELRLYILICMLSHRGCCNKKNRLFELSLGVGNKAIKKQLSSLEKKGYIDRLGETHNRKIIPLKYLLAKNFMENSEESGRAEGNMSYYEETEGNTGYWETEVDTHDYEETRADLSEKSKNEAACRGYNEMLRKSYNNPLKEKMDSVPCSAFIKSLEEKYKRQHYERVLSSEKEALSEKKGFG